MDARKTDSQKQLKRQWRILSLIPQKYAQPKSTKQISDEPTYLSGRSDARFSNTGTPNSLAMWRASKLLPVRNDGSYVLL